MSCQRPSEEITLLNSTIDRLWRDNLEIANSIAAEVEDGGNRNLDVRVLNHTKELLKKRKSYGIPESSDLIDSLFNKSLALNYVSFIQTLSKNEKLSLESEHLANTISFLSKEYRGDKTLQKRISLISLLMLESDFLVNRARSVGSSCGFGHSLNFSTESDNLQVGEYHESITSVAEFEHDHTKFIFRNVTVTLNNKPVEFEFKTIGMSLFLRFLAAEQGKYKFSFDLSTIYLNSEIEYKQHFETQIEAKEKSS